VLGHYQEEKKDTRCTGDADRRDAQTGVSSSPRGTEGRHASAGPKNGRQESSSDWTDLAEYEETINKTINITYTITFKSE
jgi:hypothetical protein